MPVIKININANGENIKRTLWADEWERKNWGILSQQAGDSLNIHAQITCVVKIWLEMGW